MAKVTPSHRGRTGKVYKISMIREQSRITTDDAIGIELWYRAIEGALYHLQLTTISR